MSTRSGGPTGRGAVALFLYYDIAATSFAHRERQARTGTERERTAFQLFVT
jgi:hypothetical protein